jgi:hypothetical protein
MDFGLIHLFVFVRFASPLCPLLCCCARLHPCLALLLCRIFFHFFGHGAKIVAQRSHKMAHNRHLFQQVVSQAVVLLGHHVCRGREDTLGRSISGWHAKRGNVLTKEISALKEIGKKCERTMAPSDLRSSRHHVPPPPPPPPHLFFFHPSTRSCFLLFTAMAIHAVLRPASAYSCSFCDLVQLTRATLLLLGRRHQCCSRPSREPLFLFCLRGSWSS